MALFLLLDAVTWNPVSTAFTASSVRCCKSPIICNSHETLDAFNIRRLYFTRNIQKGKTGNDIIQYNHRIVYQMSHHDCGNGTQPNIKTTSLRHFHLASLAPSFPSSRHQVPFAPHLPLHQCKVPSTTTVLFFAKLLRDQWESGGKVDG